MEKFVRRWATLCAIFTIFFIIAVGITSAAEEYFQFEGKVVGMHKDQLTVIGDAGETLYFASGRGTVFVPTRLPGIDERVKVTYYLRRGENTATQVEILSANK